MLCFLALIAGLSLRFAASESRASSLGSSPGLGGLVVSRLSPEPSFSRHSKKLCNHAHITNTRASACAQLYEKLIEVDDFYFPSPKSLAISARACKTQTYINSNHYSSPASPRGTVYHNWTLTLPGLDGPEPACVCVCCVYSRVCV